MPGWLCGILAHKPDDPGGSELTWPAEQLGCTVAQLRRKRCHATASNLDGHCLGGDGQPAGGKEETKSECPGRGFRGHGEACRNVPSCGIPT